MFQLSVKNNRSTLLIPDMGNWLLREEVKVTRLFLSTKQRENPIEAQEEKERGIQEEEQKKEEERGCSTKD